MKEILTRSTEIMGDLGIGNLEKSFAGLKQLAEKNQMTIEQLADEALEIALKTIQTETIKLLETINQRPVYTVEEVVHGEKIDPQRLYVMGGPAAILAPLLKQTFDLATEVPDNFAVANAIGAALTRTTMEIELFADTGKKIMFIPNLDIKREVNSSYSLSDAQEDGVNELVKYLKKNGHPEIAGEGVSIVEAEAFNMVDDYSVGSKTIRVSCQIKPGLEKDYLEGIK